jgi:hypothetical protein
MCAVRALTEGDPSTTWKPETAGDEVSGVVLRQGVFATNFGLTPFVDLWLGGFSRIRVKAFGESLRHALDGAAPQIGDRLQIRYDGQRKVESGRWAGQPYKCFSANVQHGH